MWWPKTERQAKLVALAARNQPVQRYYRDVRAGLHHPPMDDVTLATLARTALAAAGTQRKERAS